MASCFDCGREYGEQHGFPDLIIPNDTWRKISPSGDTHGLLCPCCIIERLQKAGISGCPGAFMSGPIDGISRHVMQAYRMAENAYEWLLKQQEEDK